MPIHTGLRDARERGAAIMSNSERRTELVQALDTHAGLIIQSAARVLGSVDEGRDVAQDLAEKLLRTPPADVRSWPAMLRTLAVNAAIDRLRRRRETAELPETADHDSPEVFVGRAEKAAALRDALSRLSDRDATLFSLHYLADLPQADIGRQLDMSVNAVGVALHRVRQRLAALLDPSLKPETAGDAS